MAVFRMSSARLSVAAVTGPVADLDPQLVVKFVMKEQEGSGTNLEVLVDALKSPTPAAINRKKAV